jgi:hypothetical protein
MAGGGFADDGLVDLHRVLEGHLTRGALPILLTQRAMSSPAPPPIFTNFYAGIYRALDC